MTFPTRNRETIYADYIFRYHPDFAGLITRYSDRTSAFHIEGGDILNLSDTVLGIGISQRTTPDAIEQIARKIFEDETSTIRTVLAFKIPVSRAFMLVILTAVDRVCINFNKPDQKELPEMNVADAKKYIAEKQFAPGSMTLEDIASLTGFADASHLTKRFIEQTGIKPAEYRRIYRKANPTFGKTDKELAYRITDYIYNHFATEKFKQEAVAEHFGISVNELNRSLLYYTGKSFENLLNFIRVNKAAEKLISTDETIMPVLDIGHRDGVADLGIIDHQKDVVILLDQLIDNGGDLVRLVVVKVHQICNFHKFTCAHYTRLRGYLTMPVRLRKMDSEQQYFQ